MGNWVNAKGWLKDYVKKAPVKEPSENFGEAVIFIRPRCPKCHNKKISWYGRSGNIRYYKCPCGTKFKAIEKD